MSTLNVRITSLAHRPVMRRTKQGLLAIALGWLGFNMCLWGSVPIIGYLFYAYPSAFKWTSLLSLSGFFWAILFVGVYVGLIVAGTRLAIRPLPLRGRTALYAILVAHSLSIAAVAVTWLLAKPDATSAWGEFRGTWTAWSSAMIVSMAILVLIVLKDIARQRSPLGLILIAFVCIAAIAAIAAGVRAVYLPILGGLALLFWMLTPIIVGASIGIRRR